MSEDVLAAFVVGLVFVLFVVKLFIFVKHLVYFGVVEILVHVFGHRVEMEAGVELAKFLLAVVACAKSDATEKNDVDTRFLSGSKRA